MLNDSEHKSDYDKYILLSYFLIHKTYVVLYLSRHTYMLLFHEHYLRVLYFGAFIYYNQDMHLAWWTNCTRVINIIKIFQKNKRRLQWLHLHSNIRSAKLIVQVASCQVVFLFKYLLPLHVKYNFCGCPPMHIKGLNIRIIYVKNSTVKFNKNLCTLYSI